MGTIKVSSRSNPHAVAGAIAAAVREQGTARLQVIGAGALNQAVKAAAIARGFMSSEGYDLVLVPAFADVEIDGSHRTGLRLTATDRHAPVSLDEGTVRVAAEPART